MNVWQVFAATLATAIPIVAVARLMRAPAWNVGVMLAQVAVLPEMAFVAYALRPAEPPSIAILAPAGAAFYLLVAAGYAWAWFERPRLMQPSITLDAIERVYRAGLVVRCATALLITSLAFAFEPPFAVVNLVANATWLLIWVPSRWRKTEVRVSREIAVSPR